MKILLIEDNPADQRLVKELIREFDRIKFDLVTEDKLGKGLEHLSDDEIGVILLDLNLPDSSGLETFLKVSRQAEHIPIIILTGLEDDRMALEAVQGGAQDFLIKGEIDSQGLQTAIRYAIERHRIFHELKKTTAKLHEEEQALRESEAQLNAVIQGSPIPQFVIDRDHRVIYWNRALEELSGMRASEVVGTNQQWKAFYPHERPVMADLLIDGAIDKVPAWYEGKYSASKLVDCAWEATDHFPDLGKTGKWLHFTAAPIRDAQGTIIGAVETLEDITERKAADEKIAHLASFPELNPDPVLELDSSREVIYANPAVAKTLERLGLGSDPRIFLPEDFETILPVIMEGDVTREVIVGDRTFLETIALASRMGTIRIYTRDITERKRAEDALRESETRYRNLFESSRDAIMTLEPPSWRFTSGNPATVKMFMARDEAEFTSKEPWVLSPERQPDGRGSGDKAKEMIETAMRNGTHFFEWTHKRLNGEEFPATVLLSRVELAGKVFLQATVRDITDRKRAEEALKQSEERYKRVIESQTEFITRFAPNSTVTFVNDAFLKYFDLNRDEIIGKRFKPEIPKEDREVVGRHFASLTKEAPVASIEHRIIMPDGKVKWQRWIDRAIYDDDGNLVEYQSVGRDTTERKQAEEALKNSESYLKNIFASVQTGLLLIDPETHIIQDANPATLRMFRAKREEIVGSVCHNFICPAEKGNCPITDKGQRVDNSERIFLTADGTRVPVLKTVVPVTISGRKFLLENFIDITDRKRAEETLEKQYSILKGVLESTHSAVFSLDRNYCYTSFNSAHANVMRALYGAEIELGRSIFNYQSVEEDRERAKLNIDRALKGKQFTDTSYSGEEGRVRQIFEVTHSPIKDTENAIVGVTVFAQDITERKRAEKALQESRERYRQIVEGTNAGVWVLDTDLSTIYANEQMARMLGSLPGEMLGRSISDFVFSEDRAEISEVFAGIGDGISPDTEFRFRRKDQLASWLRVAAGPFYDVQGQRVGFTGIFSDITSSKLAEEAKREAEEKFRNIFEFAVEGIYQINPKGRFLTANPAMARIMGYDSVEDLITTVRDTARQLWVVPEQRQQYLDHLKKDGIVNGFECEYFRKDGSRIWVSLNTRAVGGPDGKVVYSEGTLEDITQRKMAEQALKDSEEMFRNPVELSPVGVFLVQDNLVMYANPRLAEMAGYSRNEMFNRSFDSMILPDDLPGVKEAIGRLLRGDIPAVDIEFRAVTKDGTLVDVEAYGSTMLLHGHPALFGTIIDITERKKMAHQISESLKEKEVLLREIHHRVKNNMQVISSLLSVQAQNIKDEGVRGLFKESQNRIRSIALVHELLYRSDNLYQIEYGAYLKKMFIPLFESYSVDQSKVSIAIEALKVMITIDKAVPCSLIVNELLSNSLKHAFPGERKGAITIRFGLDAGKGEYSLDYGDNGIGLPPGLDIKTLNTLGMRLINGLTKQLEGTIEVQGSEGTHFRITFPGESAQGGR